MNSRVIVAALTLLTACAPSGAHRHGGYADDRLDDAIAGQSLAHFSYSGHWEHIRARNDGRYGGTSSRTRYAGDSFVLPFNGEIVRLYGVRGPNGGDAAVGIDGRYYGTASFFAPHKEAHALIFESPPLTDGTHTLGIVVQPRQFASHRAYVNVDEVEVLRPQ